MTKSKSASKKINGSTFEVLQDDITKQKTEAIVNAANKKLAPGGGVAGAIHRAAGEKLWEECKQLGGCETGEAKITDAYELPCSYIIHTVGPVYSNSPEDPKLLARSYYNSLKLASENDIESISFPALSTGAFGYPVEEAAKKAFETISDYLAEHRTPELVRMVLFSEKDFKTHKEALQELEADDRLQ